MRADQYRGTYVRMDRRPELAGMVTDVAPGPSGNDDDALIEFVTDDGVSFVRFPEELTVVPAHELWPLRTDYDRDELIEICERAVVPEDKWRNRDSPATQIKVGMAWVLLKASCDFRIMPEKPEGVASGCFTDTRTIWLEIDRKTFNTFETDRDDRDELTVYLPTPAKLDANKGSDWY